MNISVGLSFYWIAQTSQKPAKYSGNFYPCNKPKNLNLIIQISATAGRLYTV